MRYTELLLALALVSLGYSDAFSSATVLQKQPLAFVAAHQRHGTPLFMSSFAADGSEYSSKDSDYDDEEYNEGGDFGRGPDDEEYDAPVEELKPVPMSKNAGNRFVALIWDADLDTKGRDAMDLHLDRDKLVEDHVMFCRKRNLYNETFNTDSMVDILRSLPV